MESSNRGAPSSTDATWELAGYALWVVGSVLFAIASARNGDTLSFLGSVLFFAGIMAVMVPLYRKYRLASQSQTTDPSSPSTQTRETK